MSRLLPALASLTLLASASPALAQGGNASPHAPFDALLKAHVKDGKVSYRGFAADREALARYLVHFASTDPSKLSRAEQFAFWINAYNAFTIQLILGRYPKIASIRDIWQPWDQADFVVNGEKVTLNHIEHQVLRKMGDPRIHAAIVCASISCPDLPSEAFRAEILEEQLANAMRRFLADPTKGLKVGTEPGRLWGESRVVRLSKIFSWFQEDFGADDRAVLARLDPYLTEAQRDFVKTHRDTLVVRYFDYDWNLNGE